MSQPVERESLEVDVLFVGAGPATLASALHLQQQIAAHDIEPPTILVIEKGAAVGEHVLSGAVMNPRAIAELMPDWREKGFPIEHICTRDSLYFFTKKRHFVSPITPPPFKKKGYPVVSISKIVKWMAERCEEAGIEIYPGFAGDELLTEGDRVVGVRTGDMGVDKNGKPKANFQPGMDIYAKVTVLGEGVLGTLTKQLIERFDLQGRNPQVYETGIKEIWKIDPKKHRPGRVIHGMGWPNWFKPVSGMWLYDLQNEQVSLGYVTMLDAESPWNNPHLGMQRFKEHPWLRDLLDGAELVKYGARCLPVGGIYAQPKLYTDGALIVGDSAGFCNAEKLAGIHMAIKSGMMAAETIVDALRAKDTSSLTLGGYAERYRRSWAWQEHMEARNFHGSWEKGAAFFFLNQPFRMITGGRGLVDPLDFRPGWAHTRKLSELEGEERTPPTPEFDRKLTFDRETLVQYAGANHDADQPSHLVVADTDLCRDVCTEEYGNPCEHFCPAHVYEMVPDDQNPGKKSLLIHHENCVHCKTCDIADPYQVITWTPPEGGQGIDYSGM